MAKANEKPAYPLRTYPQRTGGFFGVKCMIEYVRYPIAKAGGLCLHSTATQTPRAVLLWLHRTTHHGNRSSTGRSDKAPVLNQNLAEKGAL